MSNQKTCINCNETYSIDQKRSLEEQLAKEKLTLGTYPHTCPECIQQELLRESSSYKANLLVAAKKLKKARKAYNTANIKHEKLASKHRALIAQERFIQFYLLKAAKPTAPAKTSRKRGPNKRKQCSAILALLNSLTPEQRAIIAKQAAQL